MVPLLQDLLSRIPAELQPTVAWIALAAAVIGVVLWLAGAYFSRSLITLAGVATGTALGLRIPQWMGWSIQPWATAIAGALVLGLLAFALHRVFVAILLAAVLGAWGIIGSWIIAGAGPDWAFPKIEPSTTVWGYVQTLWGSLPQEFRQFGPALGAVGLAVGLALGVMLGRIATALLWSILGVSVAIIAGWLAAHFRWPDLLGRVPADHRVQLGIAAGAVVVGTLLQYWMTRPKRNRPSPLPPPPAPSSPVPPTVGPVTPPPAPADIPKKEKPRKRIKDDDDIDWSLLDDDVQEGDRPPR